MKNGSRGPLNNFFGGFSFFTQPSSAGGVFRCLIKTTQCFELSKHKMNVKVHSCDGTDEDCKMCFYTVRGTCLAGGGDLAGKCLCWLSLCSGPVCAGYCPFSIRIRYIFNSLILLWGNQDFLCFRCVSPVPSVDLLIFGLYDE